MKVTSNTYLTAGSPIDARHSLQNQVSTLQKRMIKERIERNFEELEKLERQIDQLQQRLRSAV